MGASTAIAWCDSTWNPWIGCTKVSPGCDACYAEALDRRYEWGGARHWGAGVPRRRTSTQYWEQPRRWDRVARDHGKARRVFPSLCDPFDNEVPPAWRSEFFALVSETPRLTWLLLTKRIGNVRSLLPVWWEDPEAWEFCAPGANAWIGASIVDQAEADRDIPKLLAIESFARRFVSHEPALGPIDWWEIPVPGTHGEMCDLAKIDQIIVGGESSQGGRRGRPFELEWARSTIKQCREARVAPFVKQLGSCWRGAGVKHRAGADPSEWPEDLRVQEIPE